MDVGAKCPRCGKGKVRERTGPRGLFHGCTRFPRCRWSESIRTQSDDDFEDDWSIMYNPDETHDFPGEGEMIRGF